MQAFVLNQSFETVAVVEVFKSFIWTDRFDACGDFELYLPMDANVLDTLKEDYYLTLNDSEHAMIIEDFTLDSDVEDGDYITVTGRSLESILDRRIIWGQKILKGSLQDSVLTLLNENVISPTNSDRKISNFIFSASTDSKVTELTIDTQYTGDNLYDVISTLCVANEIGFKIVLNDENQFVFSLYAGADRSYNQTENPYVVFSPQFENILSSNYYSSKATYKNVTLVAGEGEGAARKTAEVGEASGLDRRELFTDARDISSNTQQGTLSESEYTSQLKDRGTEKLAGYAVKTAFEGEAEATKPFTYGKDFYVGDIVQIANGYGQEGIAYISELVMSQDESGTSVYPTFKMYE